MADYFSKVLELIVFNYVKVSELTSEAEAFSQVIKMVVFNILFY